MLIIHIKETGSTSNYLKALSLNSRLDEGTVVVADFQSAGKGQQGNSWESERGENLLFSIILYPEMVKANEQFILSQIVSLAVAKTLSHYTDYISIKWPNDVYWQNKKICGILVENQLLSSTISQSVIGIGININQENFKSDAPNPVSLKQITKEEYSINKILEEVHSLIIYYYEEVKRGCKSSVINSYKEMLFRRKGYHLYNDGKVNFMAEIQDIEPGGMLILKTDTGEERRFAFKEVKYILE